MLDFLSLPSRRETSTLSLSWGSDSWGQYSWPAATEVELSLKEWELDVRRETNPLFSPLRIEVLYFGSEKSEKSQHFAPPVMKI